MQNTRSNVEKFSIDRYTEEYILLSTPYRASERAFERVFLDERKRKKWNEVKKRRNKTLVQVDPSRKRKEKNRPPRRSNVCHPRDSHHPPPHATREGVWAGGGGGLRGRWNESLCLIRKHCNCLEYYIR